MQVNPPAHNPSSTGFMIRFSILLGLIIGGFYPAAKATTLAPKPPVLLKQNAQWWNQSTRPHPVQGWDTFTQSIKNYHPNIKQAVNDKGTLIFLIHMRVNKKGRVDFAEVWDANTQDSGLKSTLIEAIQYNTFTPFLKMNGKRDKNSTLVLMEIPTDSQQLLTQAQDTTIPNKAIIPARFLGGENAFNEYIANQFEYPSRCVDASISGYVRMRFMVDRNGVVTNCRIKEYSKACPEFGIEAIRVLKNCPKWIPATHNGKNISAWFEVPIALSIR
jgi:TonB family protein